MKDKKVIGLTIVSLAVLVVAIIATSYAIFSASFTGTKENVLTSGYVVMNCNSTTFSLTNTKPLTDAEGIALNNNEATCTLSTTMSGTMTIGYDVALADVDISSPSDSLGESNVKIRAQKIHNNTTSYLVNSTSTTGVLVNSIASNAGTYDSTITGYTLDSATTNQTDEVVYKVKAWVSGDINGLKTTTTTNGKCSDPTKTTEEACTAAGGIWGYDQKTEESGGTFSFKLKVGASQVLD